MVYALLFSREGAAHDTRGAYAPLSLAVLCWHPTLLFLFVTLVRIC